MTARSSAGAASSGAGGKELAAVLGGSEFPLPGHRFWAIIGKAYLTDPRHCPVLLKKQHLQRCSAREYAKVFLRFRAVNSLFFGDFPALLICPIHPGTENRGRGHGER